MLCRISMYSGSSVSLFLIYKNAVCNGGQNKESNIRVRMDRKIRPSQSPFVITPQAS